MSDKTRLLYKKFSESSMSEKRAQKFHTDDVHCPYLGSASDWLKENSLAA